MFEWTCPECGETCTTPKTKREHICPVISRDQAEDIRKHGTTVPHVTGEISELLDFFIDHDSQADSLLTQKDWDNNATALRLAISKEQGTITTLKGLLGELLDGDIASSDFILRRDDTLVCKHCFNEVGPNHKGLKCDIPECPAVRARKELGVTG